MYMFVPLYCSEFLKARLECHGRCIKHFLDQPEVYSSQPSHD